MRSCNFNLASLLTAISRAVCGNVCVCVSSSPSWSHVWKFQILFVVSESLASCFSIWIEGDDNARSGWKWKTLDITREPNVSMPHQPPSSSMVCAVECEQVCKLQISPANDMMKGLKDNDTRADNKNYKSIWPRYIVSDKCVYTICRHLAASRTLHLPSPCRASLGGRLCCASEMQLWRRENKKNEEEERSG